MLKLKLSLIALVSGALLFSSCTKDDSASSVTNPTGIPSPTFKHGLTIHVLSSSVNGRSEGLSAATVTVKQNGATIGTVTTDETGIAAFAGLTEGEYSYFIKAADYASVNGAGFIQYDGDLDLGEFGNNDTQGGSTNNYGINGEIAYAGRQQVTLKKLGATVTAKIFGNFDFSTTANNFNDPLAAGTVVLTLSNSALQPNTFSVSPSAAGVVTFTGLPENENYTLRLYHTTTDINQTPANEVTWSISGTTRTTPLATKTANLGNLFANNGNN